MKPIIWLMLGLLTGAAATAGRTSAETTFHPVELVGRGKFLEKLPGDAQVRYLEGMSDAFAFLRPENAVGKGLTECFKTFGVQHGFDLYSPFLDQVKAAPPTEPIAAVFLRMVHRDCKEFIK